MAHGIEALVRASAVKEAVEPPKRRAPVIKARFPEVRS
jgi:hypothetical protein